MKFIQLIIFISLITCNSSMADVVSHTKWSVLEKNLIRKQLVGKIGDEIVAIVPEEDENSIKDQMILVKGSPAITIHTKKGKVVGEYIHVIAIRKILPYYITIEPGEKDGIITYFLSDSTGIVRVFFTDKKLELVQVNL